MWYTKEREFIVSYTTEDSQCLGKFNILTGTYVGKTGKVISRMPVGFDGSHEKWYNRSRLPNNQPSVLSSFYAQWYKDLRSLPQFFPQLDQELETDYINRLNSYRANAEKLISLRLRAYDINTDLQNFHLILTKTAVNFMHEYVQSTYDSRLITPDFVELIRWIDKQGFPKSHKIKKDVTLYCRNIPASEQLSMSLIKLFIERANDEKLYDSNSCLAPISFILYNYVKMHRDMHHKIKIPHNILANYDATEASYERWKEKYNEERLVRYNGLAALYYENDTYKIFPLLTIHDFHDEATQQKNCVERIYLSNVLEFKTHIVVVRKKDDPLKSFITCEVTNKGIINQFLLSYNRDITGNAELKALKSEYQQHLKDNWTTK